MAVVVDANILVVFASNDPRQPAAQSLVRSWLEAHEDIHAPELLHYEVANSLTRLVSAGALPASRIHAIWQYLSLLPITLHPIDGEGSQIVELALRLGRQSAYDAAYLALTQRLGAQLWTFDGPLARNATGLGLVVHLITLNT